MDQLDRSTRWIWLSLACGAGSKVPEALYSAFGDIEAIYEAGESDYTEIDENINCLAQLCDKSLDRAMQIMKWCEMKRVGVLTPDSPAYPVRLYETQAFPCVLYSFGRLPDIDRSFAVACVGTRKMTDYGKNNAYAVSRDLAKEGAIIVSGLALGIDAVCHRAALDVGGSTIAVLGNGLDRSYPPQNRDLMVEIARKGAILTEFPPFTEPAKFNFPIRNRIISGISNAAMVFEADLKSGSLITARYAKKQGRKVYALPGNAGNLTSSGTNDLLARGDAKAAVCAGDILSDFKDEIKRLRERPTGSVKKQRAASGIPDATVVLRRAIEEPAEVVSAPIPDPPKPKPEPITREKAEKLVSELSVLETQVYDTLTRTDPLNVEQLRIRTGLPVNKVFAAVTMLEVKKLILSTPGGGYVRVR